MPIYRYRCDAGHEVEETRPVSARDVVRPCGYESNCRGEPYDDERYLAEAGAPCPPCRDGNGAGCLGGDCGCCGDLARRVCALPRRRVPVPCADRFPGADSWRKP